MPVAFERPRFGRNLSTLVSAILLLMAVGTVGQTAPTSMRPTASQPAAELDAVWQRPASKFATQRKEILQQVQREVTEGPYREDWASLQSYEVPDWYKDAKFGIFIHWGVYSVPAYGSEWYPREMYREGSDIYKYHLATYGPPSQFGYKDFVPSFKGRTLRSASLSATLQRVRSKKCVPVFEHHDGFAMYDSGLSDWTAA